MTDAVKTGLAIAGVGITSYILNSAFPNANLDNLGFFLILAGVLVLISGVTK